MVRLITNNWQLKLLALLLAIILSSWIYRFGDYEMKSSLVMRLEERNLAEGMAFLERLPKEITVNVAGNLRQLNLLKRMSLVAVLDMKSFTLPGSYTISPEIPDVPELKVVGALPMVRVRITDKMNTSMLIEVWHVGELPKGYILSKEGIEPKRAEIEGPKELVERVKHVIAEVGMSDRLSRFSQSVPLLAYSAENEPLDSDVIKIAPASVLYRADVNPVANVKVVRVDAVLSGEPKSGYYVKEVRLTPSQILFEDSLFEKHPLRIVNTKNIDLDGKAASFTQQAALDYGFTPPEGLPRQVTVQVVLAKYEADEASMVSVTIQLMGGEQELEYIVRPPGVAVQSSEFEQLSDEERKQIEVKISVEGLVPGVYRVVPEIVLPGSVQRAAIVPDSVEVTVVQRE